MIEQEGKTTGEIAVAEGFPRASVYQALIRRAGLSKDFTKPGRRRLYPHLTKTEVRMQGHLRTLYGMTLEQYRELDAAQGGVCAICRQPPAKRGYTSNRLHVDHDHQTGRVRGLLCEHCNHAIGKLEDSPELLMRAAQYVRETFPAGTGAALLF